MKAKTETQWAERVQEWRKSRKTATEFAADKPYAGSTLQWAASRLQRMRDGQRRRGTADTQPSGQRQVVRLAKVVRRAQREDGASELLVEVGGARITVRRGFNVPLLRAVVHALKEER